MNKDKTVIFRLSKEKYDRYKNMCKKQGFNMSQRFRNFIDEELNKEIIKYDQNVNDYLSNLIGTENKLTGSSHRVDK